MPARISLTHMIEHFALVKADEVATVNGDRIHTWAELRRRIAALAYGLEQLGLVEEDRLAVLSLNSDRYLETYFTPWWMGAVVVPLNTRWSAKENSYALTDSAAKVLFFEPNFMAVVEQLRTEPGCTVEHFIYMSDQDCPDWAIPYESLVESGGLAERSACGDDDMAAILYTGGTTGHPKGVMLCHTGIWTSSLSVSLAMEITGKDICLHAAPMFHVADMAILIATLIRGGRNVFIPQFEPDAVLNALETYKITLCLLVPTMVKIVLAAPKLAATDISSLHTIAYGASPMPEGVLLDLMEKMPNVDLVQAYGQTEMSPIVSLLHKEDHTIGNPRLRSAGKPTLVSHVRIVGEDGSILPPGEVGEIHAAGATVMLGYLNMPEQTAETLKDGWVASGDAGYMDEDGYIYLVDRVKDMIISGGENVFSAEVESAVSTHAAIQDVAVIGIPDDKWGEAVHAIVIIKQDQSVTEQELIDHCKTSIAGYKCPRSIEFRTEPFPLSGAGKTLKRDMRKPYWEGKAKRIN